MHKTRNSPQMWKDEKWELRVRSLYQGTPVSKSEVMYPHFNCISVVSDLMPKLNTIYTVCVKIEEDRESLNVKDTRDTSYFLLINLFFPSDICPSPVLH